MNIIGIIPARFASTRFPGKPLVEIFGKSMIQRVIEQTKKCSLLKDVIVATDDERIFNHVVSLGTPVFMTSAEHPSGTDRCLEAYKASGITAEAIINIQGDEPFVDPIQIETLCHLISKTDVDIATLAKHIEDMETLMDPNKVKVIFDASGKAIYFSRHAIPFQKGTPQSQWLEHFKYFKHLGLYAYKTAVLQEICQFLPSSLELAESLEQLRWLENGKAIYLAETDRETPAIDTPADLEKVLRDYTN
jgi:3-deoxy-manno-octulosonate cytidylyltransferase (CMP-KDO synthetase)